MIKGQIKKIYNNIHLNLGIKKFLESYIFTDKYIYIIDSIIIYPIFEKINKYLYKRIIYHFGADYRWGDQKSQNIDHKNFNYGYGHVHYSLIRSQRFKNILCIGSMYGFIPYMMARACKENGYGHVDFVDAGYSINEKSNKNNHYYGQGFWKNNKSKKHFEYLGANKYITTHVTTSSKFTKNNKTKYDYIYLDGDHSYEGAKTNIRYFWPKLNKNGFICFHDIKFDKKLNSLIFEHGKVWDKLSKMPYKFELSNGYSGLGFIQKITNENPLIYLK